MKCPNCGRISPEGSKVCMMCGMPFSARATGVLLWDRDTLRRMLTYVEHMEGKTAQGK